jgi:hypothetical protein
MGARIVGRFHDVTILTARLRMPQWSKHTHALPLYDAPTHGGRQPSAFARAHVTQRHLYSSKVKDFY